MKKKLLYLLCAVLLIVLTLLGNLLWNLKIDSRVNNAFGGAFQIRSASTLPTVEFVTINSASTTLCSVCSNPARIYTDAYLIFDAGSSDNTVNSIYRIYTSAARASRDTSSTIWGQLAVNSSTIPQTYGNTTTQSVYTPANQCINATSTAITSSTGKCVLISLPS